MCHLISSARLLTKGLKCSPHRSSFWPRSDCLDRERLVYKAINHIFCFYMPFKSRFIQYTTIIYRCGKIIIQMARPFPWTTVQKTQENIEEKFAVLCVIFIRYSMNRLWAVWGYTIYKVWFKRLILKEGSRGKQKERVWRVHTLFKQTSYPLQE